MEEKLRARSGNVCELCGSAEDVLVYEVPAAPVRGAGAAVLVCPTCFDQLTGKQEPDSTHWQCLSTTMWSEEPAVQVVAWRMLNRLKQESWAADSLDMLYLDDETRAWAEAAQIDTTEAVVQHKDSNGNILSDGDSVVLIKTLDVKGSSLQAKLGTVVRHIRLVADNPEQIEGKIDGQAIVILTKYLRKQ